MACYPYNDSVDFVTLFCFLPLHIQASTCAGTCCRLLDEDQSNISWTKMGRGW